MLHTFTIALTQHEGIFRQTVLPGVPPANGKKSWQILEDLNHTAFERTLICDLETEYVAEQWRSRQDENKLEK